MARLRKCYNVGHLVNCIEIIALKYRLRTVLDNLAAFFICMQRKCTNCYFHWL